MSSASEPPIMAKTVEVLDNTCTTTETMHHHTPPRHHEGEARLKNRHRLLSTTTTMSESSDSSLLWTPQAVSEHTKKSNSRRSQRRKHKNGRRLWSGEQELTAEETSPFLPTHGEQVSKDSFERNYEHHHHHHHRERRSRSHSPRSRRSHKHKQHRELYNDYTRYQYGRRSQKDKKRKHDSSSKLKSEDSKSSKSTWSKILQRIKDFFTGKPEELERGEMKERHSKPHSSPRSSRKHKKQQEHISGKLFRSASDSDIEVVKHHQRHKIKHGTKDDLYSKHGRHWKTKHSGHKLSSICESSDKTGDLDRVWSGSDGRLVLARRGNTTYNDVMKYGPIKHRDETSEGSHSQHEFLKQRGRHGRRSKDYRSLKKKWAKQHQSFENDLEKLEKLVEMVSMKKNSDRLEQKAIEDTILLERLEAKQEKCVAEVDFTRHVLVCKLQRLENKLENSLCAIDSNNNTAEDRERGIEEIREEMSKECRDLRKLLQETSEQLRQVLEEKNQAMTGGSKKTLEHCELTQPESTRAEPRGLEQDEIPSLSRSDVPFPELSHHPLNQGHKRLDTSCTNKSEGRSRVSTYV